MNAKDNSWSYFIKPFIPFIHNALVSNQPLKQYFLPFLKKALAIGACNCRTKSKMIEGLQNKPTLKNNNHLLTKFFKIAKCSWSSWRNRWSWCRRKLFQCSWDVSGVHVEWEIFTFLESFLCLHNRFLVNSLCLHYHLM